MEKYASPPDIKKLINRPRSDFWNYNLVGLTHEMKSPLAAIEGALEIINNPNLDGVRNGDHYVGMIKRNIHRLRVSINDLLDMYTVGGKRRELILRPTDIVKICKEEKDRYQPLVKLKGLCFDCAGLDRAPVKVRCDSSKIRLVISNMLSNAIKFTQKGSIRMTIDESGGRISVTVEDTGAGISQEDLPFVFDGFFQSESRTSKGSGIGLTIASIWIKAHHGEIRVDSEGVGKGSRFWFEIPL
ncbi:MAG: Sensor histidine kinase RcsC [Elusimicrobia bacterium]|nr:Sensor histidine kinase RcsC [Elusimicrobiota bacterium]